MNAAFDRYQEKAARLRARADVTITVRSRSDKDPQRHLWGDHWVKWELTRELAALGLDVREGDADVVIHLFGSPPRKPVPPASLHLAWLYSHPDWFTADNAALFDKVFCASRVFLPRLADLGHGHAGWLPAGTNKQPVDASLTRDVLFLGNARGRRQDGRAAVRDLIDAGCPFEVWGSGWEAILPAGRIGGQYWDYRQIAKLYASARITVTDHHADMAREGFVSNKVFDVLASGGFVIAETHAGLDALFGGAVPQYGSAGELGALVDRYLTREDERESLRRAGQSAARAHTYARAARLLTADWFTP